MSIAVGEALPAFPVLGVEGPVVVVVEGPVVVVVDAPPELGELG